MPHACKISEFIELLQQHQHDDFVLCSLWYEDDVRNVDASATDEEAQATLRHAARHHDAEQGINQDTLEAVLDAIRQ
ncbi:hypothetical protein [Enterobacter mori]|uniref:hypothetical protein n=1 Tax=Enterobacter mori TaxID=539813 RepID=UPI002B202F40|nr:hypothetical protein [Enterobacter mori]MEA5206329.1 hypothetical protein [Enterobacter mori]